MRNKILLSSAYMDWETPIDFFKKYDEKFNFTLDVCCVAETAKCAKFFTPEDNGLIQDWSGEICWMNPPYGRMISQWVKKAFEESKSATIVCLLPARTDTNWWWNYCLKGDIEFIRGRIKFRGKNKDGIYVQNNATFPSAIVIFRPSIHDIN